MLSTEWAGPREAQVWPEHGEDLLCSETSLSYGRGSKSLRYSPRATLQTHPGSPAQPSKRLLLIRGCLAEMTESTATEQRFATLMKAAQGGDAEAYATLMQELALRLRRIVRYRRTFLELADIEDLVQDILLSVHAVRATYDPARPFIPWLLAITRNRLADAARRYARLGAREVPVDDLEVTSSTERTNNKKTPYGDPEALNQAIADLPPGQRSAIEMLKLREMSLKEAASASGTSIGALKVATHRAMDALRKRLTKDR